MLRRLAVLALAVAVAACGRDDDPANDVAAIDQMRVVKVRGDQSSQVPPAGPSQSLGVRYAQVGTDGYTDEPLVARVEATEPQASLTGPSFAVVPAGTPVHWHLSDGCGKLFGATTETDDTAYTLNRWAPGTKAGACQAAAGRILSDGSIVLDATWELEVLPGPTVEPRFGGPGLPDSVAAGDTLDLSLLITGGWDAHQNPTSVEQAVADLDAGAAWGEAAQSGQICRPTVTLSHHSEGWLVVVPEPVATWQTGGGGYTACLHFSVGGKWRGILPMRVH